MNNKLFEYTEINELPLHNEKGECIGSITKDNIHDYVFYTSSHYYVPNGTDTRKKVFGHNRFLFDSIDVLPYDTAVVYVLRKDEAMIKSLKYPTEYSKAKIVPNELIVKGSWKKYTRVLGENMSPKNCTFSDNIIINCRED